MPVPAPRKYPPRRRRRIVTIYPAIAKIERGSAHALPETPSWNPPLPGSTLVKQYPENYSWTPSPIDLNKTAIESKLDNVQTIGQKSALNELENEKRDTSQLADVKEIEIWKNQCLNKIDFMLLNTKKVASLLASFLVHYESSRFKHVTQLKTILVQYFMRISLLVLGSSCRARIFKLKTPYANLYATQVPRLYRKT